MLIIQSLMFWIYVANNAENNDVIGRFVVSTVKHMGNEKLLWWN